MNILVKQHEILTALNAYRKEYDASGRKIDEGLPWDDLAKKVNLSSDELWYIATRLAAEKDIQGTEMQEKRGYYITNPEGIASLGSKKYLRERRKNIIEDIKTFTQIVIPIAALGFSILIYSSSATKIEEVEQQMQSIRQQVENIKEYQKQPQGGALKATSDTFRKSK